MAITKVQSAAYAFAPLVPVAGATLTLQYPPRKLSILAIFVASSIDPLEPELPIIEIHNGSTLLRHAHREASDTDSSLYGVCLDLYLGLVLSDATSASVDISYASAAKSSSIVALEYTGLVESLPTGDYNIWPRHGASIDITSGPSDYSREGDQLWLAAFSSENSRNKPTAASNGFALQESVTLSGTDGNLPGEVALGVADKITSTRGIQGSTSTGFDADRWSSILLSFASNITPVTPTTNSLALATGTSVVAKQNFEAEALNRLLQQFQVDT